MKRVAKNKNITQFSRQGKEIFFITIFLVLFGVLMVYSASYYYASKNYNNQFFFFFLNFFQTAPPLVRARSSFLQYILPFYFLLVLYL